MTNNIKGSLKERSNLTNCYYKNGQKKSDYEKSSNCTKEILKAKNNHILKLTPKLKDPKTYAKTYWAILIGLQVKSSSNTTFIFNNIFPSICTPIKSQVYYHCFHLGPIPE